MFKSPVNKAEYFAIVDNYWNDISFILNMYLPTFGNQWIDGTPLDKTLWEFLLLLKDTRNPRLARAFSAAYWNCPHENGGDWCHNSWSAFRTLVIEEWCLHESKEVE